MLKYAKPCGPWCRHNFVSFLLILCLTIKQPNPETYVSSLYESVLSHGDGKQQLFLMRDIYLYYHVSVVNFITRHLSTLELSPTLK